MKKKSLGSTTSHVHGKEKEIICHDMRKYVWQKYDFLKKKITISSTHYNRLYFISSSPTELVFTAIQDCGH